MADFPGKPKEEYPGKHPDAHVHVKPAAEAAPAKVEVKAEEKKQARSKFGPKGG